MWRKELNTWSMIWDQYWLLLVDIWASFLDFLVCQSCWDLSSSWRQLLVVVVVGMGVAAAEVGDLAVVVVTSYKLQVTSYKFQVTSYKLQVTSYKLQFTSYKWPCCSCSTLRSKLTVSGCILYCMCLCKHVALDLSWTRKLYNGYIQGLMDRYLWIIGLTQSSIPNLQC
jgi:hypothetical protein